jgi:hypothetical protein
MPIGGCGSKVAVAVADMSCMDTDKAENELSTDFAVALY